MDNDVKTSLLTIAAPLVGIWKGPILTSPSKTGGAVKGAICRLGVAGVASTITPFTIGVEVIMFVDMGGSEEKSLVGLKLSSCK